MEKDLSKEKKASQIVREFAAGGVVFKKARSNIFFLIAKSAPSENYPESYWRLPKGWLDDIDDGKTPGPITQGVKKATDEQIKKAALREVKEEGGIRASIIKKLGTERVFFTWEGQKILKFVTFYLMKWQSDMPEGPGFETSEIAWLPHETARKKLKHSGEKKIIDKAKALLDSGIQESLV